MEPPATPPPAYTPTANRTEQVPKAETSLDPQQQAQTKPHATVNASDSTHQLYGFRVEMISDAAVVDNIRTPRVIESGTLPSVRPRSALGRLRYVCPGTRVVFAKFVLPASLLALSVYSVYLGMVFGGGGGSGHQTSSGQN